MKKWLVVLLIILVTIVTLILLAFFSLDIIFSDYGKNPIGIRYAPPNLLSVFL